MATDKVATLTSRYTALQAQLAANPLDLQAQRNFGKVTGKLAKYTWMPQAETLTTASGGGTTGGGSAGVTLNIGDGTPSGSGGLPLSEPAAAASPMAWLKALTPLQMFLGAAALIATLLIVKVLSK